MRESTTRRMATVAVAWGLLAACGSESSNDGAAMSGGDPAASGEEMPVATGGMGSPGTTGPPDEATVDD